MLFRAFDRENELYLDFSGAGHRRFYRPERDFSFIKNFINNKSVDELLWHPNARYCFPPIEYRPEYFTHSYMGDNPIREKILDIFESNVRSMYPTYEVYYYEG